MIDTGPAIAPPDLSRNPNHRPPIDTADDDDDLSPDQAMERSLARSWDRIAAREDRERLRNPVRPERWGLEDHEQGFQGKDDGWLTAAIRAEAEFRDLPLTERQRQELCLSSDRSRGRVPRPAADGKAAPR